MRYLLAVAVDGKAEEKKKKKHDNKMIHLGLTRMIALGLTKMIYLGPTKMIALTKMIFVLCISGVSPPRYQRDKATISPPCSGQTMPAFK